MEEGQLNQEKPSKKTKFNFLTNPSVMGWIAIIGLPLGAWGIYLSYAFNKEAKPVYVVISDFLLTDPAFNSKIKISYDSIPVVNVRTVDIAFWNAGNNYVDKQAFSNDHPLSIRSTESPIRILEARVYNTTRPSLIFSLDTSTSTPMSGINLKINGDEGLEAGDGARISILYTGYVGGGEWSVEGRIKGIPSGFEKITNIKNTLDVFLYSYITSTNLILIIYTLLIIRYSNTPKATPLLFITLFIVFEIYAIWTLFNPRVYAVLPDALTWTSGGTDLFIDTK